MSSDNNLLFGVLALQAGLIDAQQFATGCSLWCAKKELSLAQICIDQGWLTPEDRDHIAYLLERNLHKHKGDEHATLAAAADPKIIKVLENLNDPDIERSLHGLSTPEDHSLMATTAFRTESRDRYTLTRLHAKGGIGQVWLARDNDLGRDVALKELQPQGAQYPEIWANLLEEARLTSQMQHPGIVPIYELSRRNEKQPPFYTMRFVKGRTLREAIKAYHERRSSGKAEVLDLRALLDAFVGVCNAVAYAHSLGVLHRDLKPQNVVLGDFGEAIVLDWGLGKVVDRPHIDLETPPVVTDPEGSRERTFEGKVLGTPAYMSPEQAAGRIELVGQASDIYGLGAILYQILTDKPPSDGSTTAEILQKVRSESPKAPHEVVADVSPALEAICLRALAKEPTDRYASAELLGHEIKRWLADEPVLAYPEPVLVRAGRWARSHRTLVASAAVLLVTLVASLAVGVVLVSQEQRRTEAQRLEAVEARQKANEQAAVSQAVNDFLNDDLLAQADPGKTPDPDVKMRTVLDRAEAGIEKRFSDQPLVEARVRNTVGSTYLSLGEYGIAERQLRAARAIYERELPIDEPNRLRSNSDFAFVLYRQGQFKDAREIGLETLDLQKRVLGIENRDTLQTMTRLADMLDDSGHYEEARKMYEDVLTIEKRAFGETNQLTLMSMNDLAVNLKHRGRLQEARKLLEDTLAIQKQGSRPWDLGTLNLMNNLASVLDSLGRYQEALQLLRDTLAIQESVLRPNHPYTLNTKVGIAHALSGLEENEKARAGYEEVLAIQKRTLPDHHRTLLTMRGLANVLGKLGKFPEARKLFEETLTVQKRTLETSNPETLGTMRDLATLLEQFGQSEESLKLKQEILAIRRAAQPPSPPDVLEALNAVAISLTSLGQNREARQMFEDLLALSMQNFEPRDPVRINAVNGLAWFLATVEQKELRDPKRAVQLSKGLAELLPEYGACWNSYGVAQYRAGDWKGAEESLTKSIDLSKGGDSNDFFFLAMANWQLGHKEEARKWYGKAVQWMDERQPKNPELVRFRAETEELMGMKKVGR